MLNWSSLWNIEQLECRNPKFPALKSLVVVVGWGGGGGGLFDYSVNLWPRFIKIKAKFGQVSDQVNQG